MNKQSVMKAGYLMASLLVAACGFASEADEVAATESAISFAGMTSAQEAAARALPGLRALQVDARGLASYLEADLGVLRDDSAVRAGDVAALRAKLAPVLRMQPSVQLVHRRTFRDGNGKAHVRLGQTIDGLEVVDAEIIVHTDARSGAIEAVQLWHLPDEGLARAPAIGADAIFAAIPAGSLEPSARPAGAPTLAYVRTADGAGAIGWQIPITSSTNPQSCPIIPPGPPPTTGLVFADGKTGKVLRNHSYVQPLYREVYSKPPPDPCKPNDLDLLVTEGGTPPTPNSADAYNNSGQTYNWMLVLFGRDSWNGAGATMTTILDSTDRNNSFWTDGHAVQLGTGDGIKFGSFARAIDVVGHEFGHGVVEATAGLVYQGESGALNESYADVFGASTKIYTWGITPDSWKLGSDIYTPSTPGDALRYLNNPTLDAGNFAYTSTDYYPTRLQLPLDTDAGGVHFNSGISNLAFYLVSQGGTHPRLNTGSVPALGIYAAEQIWYKALPYLPANATFADMRSATAMVATATERVSVCKAWDAVGVPASANCPSPPPPVGPVPPMPTSVSVSWEHCHGLNEVKWQGSGSTFRIWSYAPSDPTRGVKIFDGAVSSTPTGYSKTISSGEGAVIRVQACNANGCSDISTGSGTAHSGSGCS